VVTNPAQPLKARVPRPRDADTERLLQEFRRHQQRLNNSSLTIRHRDFRLVALAAWLEPKPLLDASTDDIELFLDSCITRDRRPIAPQTRYTYLSYIRAFYLWAHDHELITTDPTKGCAKPRLPHWLPRPIGTADLLVAMDQAEPRMAAWLKLAAFQGLRCAEITNLRVQDLWTEQDPAMLFVDQGKGRRDRAVPMHPEIMPALNRYGLPRTGLIFTREVDGRPLSSSTVSRYVGRYFRDLGIDATLHKLRHWFGTQVYRRSEGDLLVAQNLLGHASPASTAIYAAISNGKPCRRRSRSKSRR